ncbi:MULTISPECIES: Hcp family type VI secretion system effector [Pseudomonas]|uniref:Type VI secretion system tube protein Hcp n=3 Tax=Pseudomonas TaxID=286 RepID=A0ABX6HDQ1_9PSED|nr:MULTISPECIES: Hcp family type VI secretion system effector [Pseudomonas]MBC3953958.1 Hcp family type VI secretion system effector [Pseudomonas triticifolii]QHF03695.1 type VI secretion system tube protein Hcp [Pseudomonas asturiensis]
MATPAYITITSETRGVLTLNAFTQESVGSIYQEGHTDQAMVQAFSHMITIPRDPQSGQPTGQRVHAPLCITKIFDKSSPLLQQALTSGEQLSSVEIMWYRTSSEGKQEHYYTTLLEKAIIVEIKDYMYNCQDSATSQFTHLEDVHFAYRKITWTHEKASTSGSDDWGSPLSA